MQISLLVTIWLILYALTLWLGSYLLAVPSDSWTTRLTGCGLIAYAATLAFIFFSEPIPPGLWLLPALLWTGAALHLWPSGTRWRSIGVRAWVVASLPVLILALLEPWMGALPLSALLAVTVLLARGSTGSNYRSRWAVIATVSLFLTLSTGLMVLSTNWLSPPWQVTLLGVDLALLGVAVTWWDAFDEGQRVRRPLLRSFVSSFYFAGALAALVIVGVVLDGEFTAGSRFLLVSVITAGVLSQVFANHIQGLLDRLAFSGSSRLAHERRLLREAADSLPRQRSLDVEEMDLEEFKRLTRRALSDLGDLSNLASSPLTQLEIVAEGSEDNPLERAHGLKELLIDSVERLKPRTGEDFGITEEWRYYNALYFPYVVGLKPYARQPRPDELTTTSKRALEWFQSSVPERTLYNWQATAAELVAQDLLSRQLKGSDLH